MQKHKDNIPQHDLELEKVVLGSFMLEKKALIVIDLLTLKSFYSPTHQNIFKAILALTEKSLPVDLVTVVHKLRELQLVNETLNPTYVSSLTNRVGSTANIEYHTRILLQYELARELADYAIIVMQGAYEYNMDIFDLLESAQQRLSKIENNISSKTGGLKPIREVLLDTSKHYDKTALLSNGSGITGVPSGFPSLDAVTGGWQESDFIILAARPSEGKTAISLQWVRNAAVDYKVPVAVFSLEMGDVQLMQRLQSAETGIPAKKIKQAKLTEQELIFLNEKCGIYNEAKLYIDESGGQTISQIANKCIKLQQAHGLGLVVIDYIQLIKSPSSNNKNRENEVSEISKGLKELAKKLKCPVIGLSQLSRAVETRGGDKKPMLSDLRESGSLEQDADMVCFLYRPFYHGVEKDKNGNEYPVGYTEIIIKKHRNGELADVALTFEGMFSRFVDPQAYVNKPMAQTMQPNVNFDTKPADFQHEPHKPNEDEILPF